MIKPIIATLFLAGFAFYSHAQKTAPATTPSKVKTAPTQRGKLLITTDKDCHIILNGKDAGNFKAGKAKKIVGIVGPNNLEAILGLAPAAGTTKPVSPEKKTTPNDEIKISEMALINDTGTTAFTLSFLSEKMFYEYIRKNNKPLVEECLKANPKLIRSNSVEAINPILLAIETNHIEILTLLFEKGGDVNWKTDDTPLCAAIRSGKTDIIKLLLNKGADVSLAGEGNNTPLREAVYWGKEEAVKLLLEKGADAKQKANDGTTLLQIAYDKGYDSITEDLKKYGAKE